MPEEVIMALCGWKTRVFDRHRIVAERDLADGLAKLADAEEEAAPPPRGKIASPAQARRGLADTRILRPAHPWRPPCAIGSDRY